MDIDRLTDAVERLTDILERALAMEEANRTRCSHHYLYDPANNRYQCEHCGREEPI